MFVYSVIRQISFEDGADVVAIFSEKVQAEEWAIQEEKKDISHQYIVDEHILDQFWASVAITI